MTDETTTAPPAQEGGSASLATAMFAVKELRDDVGTLKKQIKAIWATVIVVAVLVVVMAVLTLLPRLFGVSVLGGGFRGQGNFNRGGLQQTAPGAQGGQGAPGTTTPGQ